MFKGLFLLVLFKGYHHWFLLSFLQLAATFATAELSLEQTLELQKEVEEDINRNPQVSGSFVLPNQWYHFLSEPNTLNPANVDASLMYRRWKDSWGEDKEYEIIISKQVWKLFSFSLNS